MRKGVLIAVLLGVSALAVAGVLHYRRGTEAASSSDAASLLEMVPADADAVVYVDLAALRASPFAMQLVAGTPAVKKQDPEYVAFVRATGFDYERDLDRFVLAMRNEPQNELRDSETGSSDSSDSRARNSASAAGSNSSAGSNSPVMVIAEGRFDRQKITDYALRNGSAEKQDGGDIFIITTKSARKAGAANEPPKTIAMRFLSDSRIALGVGGPSISSTLSSGTFADASRNQSENKYAPEMRERIARVSGAPVFAVARLEAAQKKNLPLGDLRSGQIQNLARSMRWLMATVRLAGEQINVAIDGETDTAESARQLAGTLEGLRVMGRMALGDPKTRRQVGPVALAGLDSLLGGSAIASDDKGDAHRVRLTFAVSQKAVAAPASK